MKYLGCEDGALNTETGVCSAEVWVSPPSWTDALATREQANTVGMAIFAACFTVYAMKRLLMPPRDTPE